MKRLLLHIGTGKTGTSSIQNFLFTNRAPLIAEFGVYYPETGLSHTQHFGEVIHAHYPAVFWATQGDNHNLNSLINEFERSNCQQMVLSCEDFYHHLLPDHITHLAQVFSHFSVTIVCYVRRQDLYMESAWKQQVKVGKMKIPFQDFLKWHTEPEHLEKVHGNYYRMLKPWAEAFGIDAIRVKVFDKTEWLNGDLIDDFLNAAGIDFNRAHQLLVKDASTTNTALPSELIKLIQKTNTLRLIQEKDQQDFIGYLSTITTFQDPPLLTNPNRRAILKNYRRSNRLLFEEFCKRPIPESFLPGSIIPEQRKTPPRSLEDVAVLCLAEGWKQTKSLPEVNNQATPRPFQDFFQTPFKTIFRSKNHKTLIRTIDTKKATRPSPFCLEIDSDSMFIEDDRFFFYGFLRKHSLNSPIISHLPRNSITVSNAFITEAILPKNTPGSRQTLLGAIYENGRIIECASYRGPLSANPIDPQFINQDRINKGRIVYGTCVYMGWLLHTFGHLLLEAPARFWILDSIDIAKSKFIFHPLNYSRTSNGHISIETIFQDNFIQLLFDSFGIRKNQVILADQDLFIESLVIPSPLFFLNQAIDLYQSKIYARIKAHTLNNNSHAPLNHQENNRDSSISSKRKLYFSRRLLTRAIQNRKALNEKEIENIFITYGFDIVFPEQLSLTTQIQLLNNAEIIAGCDGSALHMGIFLQPFSKMIVLTTRGAITNQLIMSALGNVETHFINAGKDRSAHIAGSWEADIDFIKENLKQIMSRIV